VNHEHLPIDHTTDRKPRENFGEESHRPPVVVILPLDFGAEAVELITCSTLMVATEKVDIGAGTAAELESQQSEHNFHTKLAAINKIPIKYVMIVFGGKPLKLKDP
jgi:hypothetical protein